MSLIFLWILVACLFNSNESLPVCQDHFHHTFLANETWFGCQDHLVYKNNKPINVLLKLDIDRPLLFSKTPVFKAYFKTVAKSDPNGRNRSIAKPSLAQLETGSKIINGSYFDAIIHSEDSGQTFFWNAGQDALEKQIEQRIYISDSLLKQPKDRYENLSVFVLPTRNERIHMNLTVELEDYSIQLGDSKNENLSVCSALVFRYNHKEAFTKRVRVHVKRENLELGEGEELNMGCTIVSVQRLDKPIQMSQGGSISNGWWQTMLSQSIIDVDVGPDATLRYGFKDGFHIVVQRVRNEKICNSSDTDDGDEDVVEPPKEVGCSDTDERNIEVRIEIDELDNDTMTGSLVVVAVLTAIIIISLFWELYLMRHYGYEERMPSSWKFAGIEFTNFGPPSIAGLVRNGKIKGYPKKSKVHGFLDVDDDDDSVAGNKNLEECNNEHCENSTMGNNCRLSVPNEEEEIPNVTGTGSQKKERAEKSNKEKYLIPTLRSADERIYHKLQAPNNRLQMSRKPLKDMRLSDMSSQCDIMLFLRGLEIKSSLYCWVLFLSGIFYFLPTIQLVYSERKISKQTRSQDLCYYNFLCRSTFKLPLLGTINDWGNFYSNIAYIFCGVYFIIVVYRRRQRRCKEMVKLYEETKSKSMLNHCSTKEHRDKIIKKKINWYSEQNIRIEFLNRCGIPEQYGLYYAIGGATILEGMLSSAYHICPTDQNFQFDTTYMFVLGVLFWGKIYQFRHPDLTINAYVAFSFVGVLLVFETVSYYAESAYYCTVFPIFYLIGMGTVLSNLYRRLYNLRFPTWREVNSKEWWLDWWKETVEFWKDVRSKKTNLQKSRVCFFAIVVVLNFVPLGLKLHACANESGKIPSSNILLLLVGINFSVYASYYVGMKSYLSSGKKYYEEDGGLRWYIVILILLANIGIITLLVLFDLGIVAPGEQRSDYKQNKALARSLAVLIVFSFNATVSLLYMVLKKLLLKRHKDAQKDEKPGEQKKRYSGNGATVDKDEKSLAEEESEDEIIEKMKIAESISFQTKLYSFLALYFMLTSLCFFVEKERSAKMSPSQSRHINAECTFMIFDNHDIWHFTSAIGILFTSLALLTLEDKNTDTPWENIRVF